LLIVGCGGLAAVVFGVVVFGEGGFCLDGRLFHRLSVFPSGLIERIRQSLINHLHSVIRFFIAKVGKTTRREPRWTYR
jgi:hypothetical protein